MSSWDAQRWLCSRRSRCHLTSCRRGCEVRIPTLYVAFCCFFNNLDHRPSVNFVFKFVTFIFYLVVIFYGTSDLAGVLNSSYLLPIHGDRLLSDRLSRRIFRSIDARFCAIIHRACWLLRHCQPHDLDASSRQRNPFQSHFWPNQSRVSNPVQLRHPL